MAQPVRQTVTALSNADATTALLLIFSPFQLSLTHCSPTKNIHTYTLIWSRRDEHGKANEKDTVKEEEEERENEDKENKATVASRSPTPNKHNKENVSKNNLWRDIIYLSSCHRNRTLSF